MKRLMLRLLFKRLDRNNPPSKPVLVTWNNPHGACNVRVAQWFNGRIYKGVQLGPGFIDYWSGVALQDNIEKYIQL